MVVSQQKRALGAFSDRQNAEQALTELKDSGFAMDRVSLVAKEVEQKGEQVSGVAMQDRVGDAKPNTGARVVENTTAASATGFVFLGLTSLMFPGLGAVLAAGSLGAALLAGTASAGAAAVSAGNLTNAFKELGIPDAKASTYSDLLQQGNYLVMVEGSEDEIHQAESIFRNRNIVDWGVY